MTPRTPAALYLRVSTADQTTANQRPDLDRLCEARGFDVVQVYAENASAAGVRSEFARLMADAKRGTFKAICVWSLDRFGRSLAQNVADVQTLSRAGVRLVSVRETWLDTGEDNPTAGLLLSIFSWVAEQERRRLRERTRAGLDRARAEGVKLGRPRVEVNTAAVDEQLSRGTPLRLACTWAGTNPTSYRRAKKGRAGGVSRTPADATRSTEPK